MSDSTPVEEPAVTKAENADTEATATSTSTTTDTSAVSGAGAAESPASDATTHAPTATDPPPTEPTPPAATTEIIPPAATPEPTAAATPAAPPREREMVADARLGVLRAMFPDFDDSLLQSVLDSVNGNTDRAIDALLGMSDPDYTSDAPQAQAEVPLSQEALDEQLARTLMLEDQRQEHAWRAQQPPQREQQRPQQQRRATGDSGGGGDAMQEFQETFNKFAESGKKTIGSLFSKVKAKIQEFDQPTANSSSSGDPYGDPYHGSAEAYERAGQSQQQQSPFPPASRHAQTAQYQPRQTPAQQQVQQQRAAMPAYYDPNAGGDDEDPDIVLVGEGGRGYDATPTTPAGVSAGSPPLPTTNTGAPALDGGKLGMLPKRPVSLLRPNEPGAGGHGAPPSSDDDEDALEYAESPFGK